MSFNLATIYGYNDHINRSKIMKYKLNILATMYIVNTNITNIPSRKENHFNLHEYYLEIQFNLTDDAAGIFGNSADIRLVNYGLMTFFSLVKLETSGG